MALVFAKNVTCRVIGDADGRGLAVCELDDRSVADQMLDPEVIRAGREWR